MDTAGQTETMTQVKTGSVTKLKLALATLALAVAGNVALASLPPATSGTIYLTVKSCRAIAGGVATEQQYLNSSCTAGKKYTYVCLNEHTSRLIWKAPCDGATTGSSFTDFYINGSCRQLDNGISITENFNNGCSGSGNYTYSCDSLTRMKRVAGKCVNGCSDPDGGLNLITRNVTSLFVGGRVVTSTLDVCTGSGRVSEGVCSGAVAISKTALSCPDAFSCSAGRCVYSPVAKCIDIDGTNPRISGVAKVIDLNNGNILSSSPDTCVLASTSTPSSVVSEAVCGFGSSVSYVTTTCAVGEMCVAGACVPPTGSLTINRVVPPASWTVVNYNNYDISSLGMMLSAGPQEDVRLTNLTLHAYVDANLDGVFTSAYEGAVSAGRVRASDIIREVTLYEGSNKVAGPVSVSAAGVAIFNSTNIVGRSYVIPKGINKSLVVRTNLFSGAPFGGNDDRYSFTFSASDVQADGLTTANNIVPTVNGAVGGVGTLINGTTNPSVYVQVTGVVSTTPTSTPPVGKLYFQMKNFDVGFDKDRILLAGTSAWVGKLQLKAEGEDVRIKDLKLKNSDIVGTSDDLESVCLYRAQVTNAENLVACRTVGSGGIVFFDDINQTLPQGTNHWYIYVNSNRMNNLSNGTADTHDFFQFTVANSVSGSVVSEGVSSGQVYVYAGNDGTAVAPGEYAFDFDNDNNYNEVVDNSTATTRRFIIAGTKIGNVEFVNSYGGESVSTVLSGTGEYTAAILAITTEDTTNTDVSGNRLQTLLNSLRFDISKARDTSISSVRVQKIGGLDPAGSLNINYTSAGSVVGIAANIELAALLPNDHKLDPGATTFFVVKVLVDSLSSASGDFFRFYMSELGDRYDYDGINISWKDGASATYFRNLLLGNRSITATRVGE